jgi:hypothetical protein
MKSMLRSLFVALLFLLPFSSIVSAQDCVCPAENCPECGQGGGGGGGGGGGPFYCAPGENPADGCIVPPPNSAPSPGGSAPSSRAASSAQASGGQWIWTVLGWVRNLL